MIAVVGIDDLVLRWFDEEKSMMMMMRRAKMVAKMMTLYNDFAQQQVVVFPVLGEVVLLFSSLTLNHPLLFVPGA